LKWAGRRASSSRPTLRPGQSRPCESVAAQCWCPRAGARLV